MRRLSTLSALGMTTLLMSTPAVITEPAARVEVRPAPPEAPRAPMPALPPNPNSPRASVPGSVRRRLARQGGGNV
ncbi:hypothetical protein EOD42_22325 [Rhodovarius crocodyli]|uniref:Uncharacterized protein n=1 Tax=Rhodovarius crocodyli TaxID=1979269 RepID=A0A437M1J4_9PROT|nr:hypothetical protein [Rhodovarius crocodyli]RVT91394.1 hypothetical protein EOD42_22325 [Rhodovarius crocodyli]